MFINVLFVIIGFILLIKGADFLVDGASDFAKKFHIPEIIIGLTIVSIGTSMPELFVSTTSALKNLGDMSLGNIIGSNLCNLLLILGLSVMIEPVVFKKETKRIEIPLCLFFTIIFMILCNIGKEISRSDAFLLILLFLLFIGYTIYMGKKGMEKSNEIIQNERKTWINIVYMIGGILFLKVGGDLVVHYSELIARELHMSDKVISLTIIAIGTSLPELVTSVTAAMKKNTDIAIGNIVGSNIFNLLLIIGVSGIIRPITYNISYNVQMIILIFSTFILSLFPYIGEKDKMTRINGVIYVMIYIAYILLLFMI